MNLKAKIKDQKELAQTYLIITTLLVTLRSNKVPINTTLLNNTTTASIVINQFQDVAFFTFIISVFVYYIVIQSNSEQKMIISFLSKMSSLLFTFIIYICLVDPIINDYIDGNNLTLTLLVTFFLLIILVGLTLISSLALENNYIDVFKNRSYKIFAVIAFFLNAWIITGTFMRNQEKLIAWLGLSSLSIFCISIYIMFKCIQNFRKQSDQLEDNASISIGFLPRL
jgi:hypothetical protein